MNRADFDQVLNHEYDGIREYDNPTPGWWNWLFAISVMFSVVYWAWYHIGTESMTIQQDWEAAQVAEFQKIFGKLGKLEPDEATISKMMDDPQMMAVARGIFAGNCAACHARDGGGITGVNLTDDVYKNVRTLGDFYNVISKGANNQAMPAWENRLSMNRAHHPCSVCGVTARHHARHASRAEGDNRPPPWPRHDAGDGS